MLRARTRMAWRARSLSALAKATEEHVVTVQPCLRKHSRVSVESHPGTWWVTSCSVCGELGDCVSEREFLDDTTESHRADLAGDLLGSINRIIGI